MKYDLTYDDDTKCIICKMSGKLHLSDLPQYGSDLASMLKKHPCKRVLQDLTEVDLKLSVVDFFDVPKLARERDIGYDVKRAIIFARDAENWRFYETVTVNRSGNVRVFSDSNKAMEWLME